MRRYLEAGVLAEGVVVERHEGTPQGGPLSPLLPNVLLDGFKERIRQITSRNGGRSLPKVVEELRAYLLGWKAYFRLADTPGVFHDLDQWIARRLRMVQLKQWKRGRTA